MSGKRANTFGQGRPERPYEEREEEAAEIPQKATAAQLAARKIKSVKPRRAGGATTPSMSASFAAPQPSGFTFGASAAPAVGGNDNSNNNNTNGMFGASTSTFGGATNSFPPSQSATPTNNFTSSSFPAFGATSQSTGFNPQPPSSSNFDFSAGGSSFKFTSATQPPEFSQTGTPVGNMFGSSFSTPVANGKGNANGNGASTFQGGFSSQTPTQGNPFSGLAQNNAPSAPSNNLFSTTSSAPVSNMFGANTSAPTNNIFGAASGAPTSNAFPASNMFNTTSAPANNMFSSAPSNNMFGATSSAPSSNMFGTTSSSAQSTGTSAPTNMFGGVNASSNNAAPAQSNAFGGGFGSNTQNGAHQETSRNNFLGTGTSAQGTQNATATAPTQNTFTFGAQSNATTSAAASNPFGSLPKPSESSASLTFGAQAQEKTPASASNPFAAIKLPAEAAETSKPSLFSSVQAPQPADGASSETPKPNLFASLSKGPTTTNSPGFNFLSAAQSKESAAVSEKAAEPPAEKAPEAKKYNLFSALSTPQPAKTAEAEKPKASLFSAQPRISTGMFSQTPQPQAKSVSNTFKPTPSFSGFKSQAASSPEASKGSTTQAAPAKEASNPFSKLPAPSTDRPNLFSPAQQAPAPASAPSSMPALTGGTELPKIPKAHVPQEWNAATVSAPQGGDSSFHLICNLTAQLQQLNEKYRTKLSNLSATADWSALSLWHHQHSSAIKKKIDIAKKQRANAKGVTGNEATVTKRKVNDESPENRDASPSKRARPAETPATPTPQPSASTPKLNPPATATSNLFAAALKKPSAPSETSDKFASKPVQTSAPATTGGFKPTPAPTLTNGGGGFKPTPAAASTSGGGGFKPSVPSGSGGFKPTVSSGSGGFAAQFAKSAKTLEQLAAERKKKAKDEDYDSDDETEEEWSARYDQEEAERIAKEKAAVAAAKGFSMPTSSKPTATSTSSSTNGLFGSRPASPASSTGGSVFDAPSTAKTPSNNIFGHLSSGTSSNHQDESEDDGEQHPVGSVEPTTPPKRKFGTPDNEETESLDEAAKRQKPEAAPKGSLLSRMTPADNTQSEKENNSPALFGQANGSTTPAGKPFSFFDFSAAGSKTASPSSDTFAGDQTYKPGTPIKFGESIAEKKGGVPAFSFQAPSTSTTPSKPPPAHPLFNFGPMTGGSSLTAPTSGLGSAPSSVFSSRAATPLSEADTSAAEDDEEGGNQEQVDLSKLTPEELESNEVVFETEIALAKHQVDQGNGKTWENFARGPLYLLKDKVSGKCFVRIRIASGATPLNYVILPKLKTQVIGSSGKMVQATMPKKEGGIAQFYISFRMSETAQEFSEKYNASLPS
ncbi:hypothetical protein HBH98_201670 [Parastagonospora nodorum]|nr:hypothetical protein HBH98_201670 [Parastagonospora nodorum]KAH4357004.1 hypothetical protein HBH97_226850 [Parastagonospora nodorum]KAH4383215.1 hypothetical protein HBH99_188510 [Parastagonospora nodorum]